MEVENNDIENLVAQLVRMIKNRSLNEPGAVASPELGDLQEAVNYLENCLYEINRYLGHLSRGQLSVEPLSRKNYLAANLKQIHSDLKNLTWQTNQVAQGDYKQRVDFLGEFSVSFNKMISQLEEREQIMTERAAALLQSKLLLVSIVDSIKEWLLVLDTETCEVLFVNLAAKQQQSTNYCLEADSCHLYQEGLHRCIEIVRASKGSTADYAPIEHRCVCMHRRPRFLTIRPYPLDWNGRSACAFLISDVTETKDREEKLQTLAFKDELTGVFNRRYGLAEIDKLILAREDFLLCFIDIDRLKYVNDTFGHASGDEYISSVADIVQASMRSSDTLCRYGGDEFILVMRNCPDSAGRQKLADARRKIVEDSTAFPKCISYGFTHVTRENTLAFDELLGLADKEMYEFKVANRQKGAEGLSDRESPGP
jgi:diguanylate cyclase (GGDEF)-like protein